MLENFKFKKHLGQNFISDFNFLNAMVNDAGVKKGDSVLEIGTGAGALTHALLNAGASVVSIEKDESLKDFLTNEFKNKNAKIIFGDFLKLEKSEIENYLNKPYKIVANLPYYITTPIIFKIVEEEFCAQNLTIMVQKEVADRLKAKPGTKDYGAITAKLNLIANISVVRQASRALFYPVPNVDSSVVKIEFKEKPPVNFKIYSRVVACAFQERRKKFVSNLSREFCLKKDVLEKVFSELKLNPNLRGEVLDFTEFAKITEKIINL